MKLLVLNGPNINLLGKREPGIYGSKSMDEYFQELVERFPEVELSYYQSNVEGELVNALQQADGEYDGVILNAGGYTHTSVVIRDAIAAIATPVVEVHISSILAREEFRHVSLIAPVVKGSIMGFGMESYRLALDYFVG